jgi:hypothetical protein
MDELRNLLDKQAIVDVVTDLFVATDRRDWKAVTACFSPEVWFDMSSLGGTPALTAAADIAAGWQKGLAPLQAVHHQAGNFRVTLRGDVADASCYGIAFHYRPHPSGRSTRTFVGTYDVGLRRDGDRWRIDRFKFDAKFVEGNLDLEK